MNPTLSEATQNVLPQPGPNSPSLERTKKKGCALLISNGFRDSKKYHRVEESANDIAKMEDLWKTELECDLFQGKAHSNLKVDEMRLLLTNFSKMTQRYDYLVVYISTHGGHMQKELGTNCIGFYAEDNKAISEEALLSYFSNNRSTHVGSIKFFILDYCRGDKNATSKNIEGFSDQSVDRTPVPLQSDIITVYATHRHQTASEDKSGSYLTDALYGEIKKNWRSHSLVDILTMVNREMKKRVEDGLISQTMSIFESSLATKFFFYETPKEVLP